MSYFLEFVRSLNEEERDLFIKIDVKGKEEQIRDLYYRNSDNANFNEQNIPDTFQVSKIHFDKILSVLLNKTLYKMYNGNIESMLLGLQGKGLSHLLLHKLKMFEKEVVQHNKKKDIQSFYKLAVDILCKINHPLYDSKLAHQYGKKYIKTLGDKPSMNEVAYINLLIHYGDMLSQCFAGNEDGYRANAFATIAKWEKVIKKSPTPFSMFYLYYTKAATIKFYGNDVKEYISDLEATLHYLKQCDQQVQKRYSTSALCELGFGYIQSHEYDKAYSYYKMAFDKKPENIGSYQPGNYIKTCILAGKLSEAENLFELYLRNYLQSGTNRSLQFDIYITEIIMYLHAGNYTKAHKVLQIIQLYKKNEITRYGQILIRAVESLYFYVVKDFTTAQILSKRNSKFMLRPENKNEQFAYYKRLFAAVSRCSALHLQGSNTPKAIAESKVDLDLGMFEIFSKLLV